MTVVASAVEPDVAFTLMISILGGGLVVSVCGRIFFRSWVLR